jgi:AcrR family transcriptional regulator
VRNRPSDTRARLRAAARRSFGREGYWESSLRAVAAEAGVTTGAVYSQYADKAALLADTAGVLQALPPVGAGRRTTAAGDVSVVLALAAEAVVRARLRPSLRALLERHEAGLAAEGAGPDRSRVLLAVAAGELVLRVAGLPLPPGWRDHLADGA